MQNINELLNEVDAKKLSDNPFSLIGDDWMLITAGNDEKYNTMTASWGGLGVLWNKNVATIFIRPQRYTYEFVEENEYFTISILPSELRNALSFCGSKSGRDYDKAKECGLTPVLAGKSVAFADARLVLVCKKLYYSDLNPDNFYDSAIDTANYKAHDYHRMYVGEITNAYIK